MAGATRIGGGVNGMHLTNTKDGSGRSIGTLSEGMSIKLSGSASRGSSKFARMVGLQASPRGGGDKISANASMKKKRPLNGPGDAK